MFNLSNMFYFNSSNYIKYYQSFVPSQHFISIFVFVFLKLTFCLQCVGKYPHITVFTQAKLLGKPTAVLLEYQIELKILLFTALHGILILHNPALIHVSFVLKSLVMQRTQWSLIAVFMDLQNLCYHNCAMYIY